MEIAIIAHDGKKVDLVNFLIKTKQFYFKKK
jgi:methylglyoxal synthase